MTLKLSCLLKGDDHLLSTFSEISIPGPDKLGDASGFSAKLGVVEMSRRHAGQQGLTRPGPGKYGVCLPGCGLLGLL